MCSFVPQFETIPLIKTINREAECKFNSQNKVNLVPVSLQVKFHHITQSLLVPFTSLQVCY